MARAGFKVLSTGHQMPSLGFGTYLLKGEQCMEAVDCALTVGYRHIDTASSYENSNEIGQVVSQHLAAGRLKRKDLFITTKIPGWSLPNMSEIKLEFEKLLDSLRVKEVDMLLLHLPWAFTLEPDGSRKAVANDILEAWKVMEEFYNSKRALGIGLSNFSIANMEKIMKICKVAPHNLQSECHVYLQQDKIRDYCQRKDIVFSGYCPLGAPLRAATQGDKQLLDDPTVNEIATSSRTTPALVLLRFLLQLGVVPLPKATTAAKIEENLKALKGSLEEEQMNSLKKLNCGVKYFKFDWATKHELFDGNEF